MLIQRNQIKRNKIQPTASEFGSTRFVFSFPAKFFLIGGFCVLTTTMLAAQPAQENETVLPWEREPQNKMPQLTDPSEKELLVDVSEEELLSIQDHLPIKAKPKLFTKFLFRVSRFGRNNLHRLAKKNSDVDVNDLESNSGFHRFKILNVTGITQSWEARELIPAVGELYDLSIYYKIKLKTNEGQNVIVYSLSLPKAWRKSQTLNEEIRFQGLFMNATLSKEKMSIMNFVADRIQWAPKTKSDLATSTGHSLLGEAGFDLSLLDILPQRNRRRLDTEDTESFYQMLSAAQKIVAAKDSLNWNEELPKFDLIQHLKSPQKFHGDMCLVPMEVRNVTRVKVSGDYVSERVGITEYFQLDGFIKFDSSVTYKAEEGSDGAVFKDKYPISVCVNQLPAGWTIGSGQNHRATFPVFFFKIWSFPTGFQSKFSAEALQQSPLFVGLSPITFEAGSSQSFSWTAVIWVVMIGIGIISIFSSYYLALARRDRSASRFQLPNKVDIEDAKTENNETEAVNGLPNIRV